MRCHPFKNTTNCVRISSEIYSNLKESTSDNWVTPPTKLKHIITGQDESIQVITLIFNNLRSTSTRQCELCINLCTNQSKKKKSEQFPFACNNWSQNLFLSLQKFGLSHYDLEHSTLPLLHLFYIAWYKKVLQVLSWGLNKTFLLFFLPIQWPCYRTQVSTGTRSDYV